MHSSACIISLAFNQLTMHRQCFVLVETELIDTNIIDVWST